MPTTIAGTLRDIIYEGISYDGGTFIIGKIDGGQIVKGTLDEYRLGENYRFRGDFFPEEPPRRGKFFRFTSYEVVVERTIGGVAQYLKNYVNGLGPVKATAIVEHFGVDTLAILKEDPGRATEIPGVSPAITEAIREHFENLSSRDPETEAKLLEMFKDTRFPAKLVGILMDRFGLAAPRLVAQEPYLILNIRGIGWELVDGFARDRLGHDPGCVGRHSAAIVEAFDELAGRGHTCGELVEVNAIAEKFLGMPASVDAWKALHAAGRVVVHEKCPADTTRAVALNKYAGAERAVARKVVRLIHGGGTLGSGFVVDGLEDEQRHPVELFRNHGLSIVTGAGGVGKTFTVARIIKALIDMGVPPEAILFLAPYGKSAKRGTELLEENKIRGVTCSTIHKALEPVPAGRVARASDKDVKSNRDVQAFGFRRNFANPLPHAFIVISEGSTLPIRLADSLFEAIKPGTRVLIDGDENQLASVGAGSFLRDLMAAGVPSFTLREIRRSHSAGTVVHACHAISQGRMPMPADAIDLEDHRNWGHWEIESPNEIADAIVSLVDRSQKYNKIWDIQVICPQKKRFPFATEPLNRRLSYLLNPLAREAIDEARRRGGAEAFPTTSFFVGDKVIRTENGLADQMIGREAWEEAKRSGESGVRGDFKAGIKFRGEDFALVKTPVVNGDMGIVLDIVRPKGLPSYAVVNFRDPERVMKLPMERASLSQAYALTTHKCIGSGFKYVIIPVHHGVYRELFNREHFYTSLSRTREVCVTVGPLASIEEAIGRKTVHLRKTRLRELVEQEMRLHEDTRKSLMIAGVAREIEDAGLGEGLRELECELVEAIETD